MSIAANKSRTAQAPKPSKQSRIITAIAIKPSPNPDEDADGNPVFQILFVETSGKQRLAPCTKTVFQQITSNGLCADHRNNFRLRLGADNLTVSSIDRFSKPELNTVFKATGEDGEEATMVFQRHADKTFSLKSQPQDTPPAIADEITELIHANPDVDMDDYLDGRYHVTGVTKKGGATMVFVSPVAK